MIASDGGVSVNDGGMAMDRVIDLFKSEDTVVVDVETNGLRPYHHSKITGLVFYFPYVNESFYLPFRHGEGMPVDYSNYDKLSNRTKAKQALIVRRMFDKFKHTMYYNNLSLTCIDRIKQVWTLPKTHIFHNAKFDLHFLLQEGFSLPNHIEDTMVALHIVFEDWKSVKVKAPYVDKKTGQWIRDSNGDLEIKEQYANRQLKWFTAFLQFNKFIPLYPLATQSEQSLQIAADKLKQRIMSTLMLDDMPAIDIKANMWMLHSIDVESYARTDTILTWYLREWCIKQITKWHNNDLWAKSCKILRDVSFRMEYNGVTLDVDNAIIESNIAEERLQECQQIFYDDVAEHSIASPKKLKETLQSGILKLSIYDELLPNWMENVEGLTTYSKYSITDTAKATLERYKDHAVIRLVQEYRKLKKSKDYLSKWINAVDTTGIVRNNMSMDGTVAGRFSSWGESGNWQNIPDRNGYTIKRAIVAKDDELIVAIDYGQLEARLASYIAEGLLVDEGIHNNYPTMTNLFLGNYDMDRIRKLNPTVKESEFVNDDGTVDLHNFTKAVLNVRELLFRGLDARQILLNRGYRLAEVDDYEVVLDGLCRFYAKTLNFGLLYSGTKYMVARELKIPVASASKLYDKWHSLFPSFSIAREHYEKQALMYRERPDGNGYSMYVTQPITGRHRKLTMYKQYATTKKHGINQRYEVRADKAKKVWNNVVQGLGGFLIPSALVSYGDKYGWEGVKPFALIHDAIELRVDKKHIYKVKFIVEEMVAFDIVPNLVVDVAYGTNWQDMKPVSNEQWFKDYIYGG